MSENGNQRRPRGRNFGGKSFGDKPRRFGDKKFGDKKFGGHRDRARGGKPFATRGEKFRRREEHGGFVHRRDLARVAGANAVKALFARAPERVERLFFVAAAKESAAGYCRVLAKSRKVFREVDAEEIARVAGTAMHGGIVAIAKPQPVRPFDPAEAGRLAPSSPLLPILHGVSNPHNLGAIARSAAFLGIKRIVLSAHPAQAGLSDAALRTAEGGFEALDVYRAADLGDALRRLKAHYRVLGATLGRAGESPRASINAPLPGRGLAPERIPLDRPIALVLGNEETGLDPATLAACDEAVTIPGSGGAVQSLNVSVAAGILFYALSPKAG
jgi:TrmH RNA methyltransferase